MSTTSKPNGRAGDISADNNVPAETAAETTTSESSVLQATASDRSGRRRFIRQGTAMMVAGGALLGSQQAFADDCDRNQGQEKDVNAAGSDSDTGEGADPTACGRRPAPKISQHTPALGTEPAPPVKKFKA